MHFSLASSPTSSSETSGFLFWTTLNGQAPEPKQQKTGPGVTTGFEILIFLKNWHCANAQIRARISCVHTYAQYCKVVQTQSSSKRNHQAQRQISLCFWPIYLYMLVTKSSHVILLGILPRAACFQTNHRRNQQNQALVLSGTSWKPYGLWNWKSRPNPQQSMCLLGFAGGFKAMSHMINVLQH